MPVVSGGDARGRLSPRVAFADSGRCCSPRLIGASAHAGCRCCAGSTQDSALTRDRFGLVPRGGAAPGGVARDADRRDDRGTAIAGTVNLVAILAARCARLPQWGVGCRGDRHPAGRSRRDLVPRSARSLATLFAVGLLASGLASTSVGLSTPGAEIMQGLLHVKIPLLWPAGWSRSSRRWTVWWVGIDPDARAGAQPGRAGRAKYN